MDQALRAQIDSSIALLDSLIARGRRILDSLLKDSSDKSAIVANRAWQQDIGVAIHQLSGGSKAHWLARAFSEAFLLRAENGQVIEQASATEIVERLVGVLEQGTLALARLGDGAVSAASAAIAPQHRRFDFVHNTDIRPVLEQAYADSRDAFEAGKYEEALITSSGILEAIVTDALEYSGVARLGESGELPPGKISDWSFSERLAVAEKAGVIRGGCARLPDAARKHRDSAAAGGHAALQVSEQDAKRTTQVLHVVMRDLDPGR